MNSDTQSRDHASNLFKNITALSSRERKPLQPKSVNISQLVASQKQDNAHKTVSVRAATPTSLSTLISKSRPKSGHSPMRFSVARVIGSRHHLAHAPAQYGIRPKKRYEQEASGALIRHLFKCVNSLETSWRLQRHGVATHQYDRRLRVQYFKSLSPTEDLAVASSSTGQEILILHRTSLRDSISLRAGSELMLDSSSSLLLYPGLRWYFQWQAVNALDSHLQSELQVSQLPK